MKKTMRFQRITPILAGLLLGSPVALHAATTMNSFDAPPPRTRREARPTTAPLTIQQPEVRYTAAQIELILERAHNAWAGYVQLRPRLRRGDLHEQAFTHRAAVLRAQTNAIERLLAAEKRKPTKEGPQTISDGLTGLDRATAAVEYDANRIALRMAQEAVLPPDQPYCVCMAPAFVRVAPLRPATCVPATEVNLSLAGGEAESFQVVVVPYWEPIRNVRIQVGELFLRDGIERLPASQVKLWSVESVATSAPLGREHLWPDLLTPLRVFDVPATASQSVLVDVRARAGQPPGLYGGRLTVKGDDVATMTLALHVRVRPFALPEAPPPRVAFRARNDFLQTRFAAPDPSRFVRTWQHFLADFDLGLYRKAGPDDSAAGWTPWLGEFPPMPVEALPADPYSPAAPTSLACRQAAWAGWNLQRRDPSPRQWLVNGWVSLDPSVPAAGPLLAPLVRIRWESAVLPNPPGLIHLNPEGDPEPTLRLVALRDGIEDYRYLELLAQSVNEAKTRRAAGWWKRRRWNALLRVEPQLGDPNRLTPELATELLHRREALGDAIEDAQRLLAKRPPRKR